MISQKIKYSRKNTTLFKKKTAEGFLITATLLNCSNFVFKLALIFKTFHCLMILNLVWDHGSRSSIKDFVIYLFCWMLIWVSLIIGPAVTEVIIQLHFHQRVGFPLDPSKTDPYLLVSQFFQVRDDTFVCTLFWLRLSGFCDPSCVGAAVN